MEEMDVTVRQSLLFYVIYQWRIQTKEEARHCFPSPAGFSSFVVSSYFTQNRVGAGGGGEGGGRGTRPLSLDPLYTLSD